MKKFFSILAIGLLMVAFAPAYAVPAPDNPTEQTAITQSDFNNIVFEKTELSYNCIYFCQANDNAPMVAYHFNIYPEKHEALYVHPPGFILNIGNNLESSANSWKLLYHYGYKVHYWRI